MTKPPFSYRAKHRHTTLVNHIKGAKKVNARRSPANLPDTASAISSRDWQKPTQGTPWCGLCTLFCAAHRMAGIGRDLCGSSSPTLLPKQGHLQQAAQYLVQAGLEYLQRRRQHPGSETISRYGTAEEYGEPLLRSPAEPCWDTWPQQPCKSATEAFSPVANKLHFPD